MVVLDLNLATKPMRRAAASCVWKVDGRRVVATCLPAAWRSGELALNLPFATILK